MQWLDVEMKKNNLKEKSKSQIQTGTNVIAVLDHAHLSSLILKYCLIFLESIKLPHYAASDLND